MIKNKIGENAGKIWHLLSKETEMPVKKLLKQSALSKDDFHMAIGWLSRENKVVFHEKDGIQYLQLIA